MGDAVDRAERVGLLLDHENHPYDRFRAPWLFRVMDVRPADMDAWHRSGSLRGGTFRPGGGGLTFTAASTTPDGRAPVATVDQLLAAARSRLVRVDPVIAAAAIEDGAVLVDVRTSEQRRSDGDVPGGIAIPLNVLEWRADLTSASHDPRLGDRSTLVVVLCAEGYCSSLAAARLLDLGRQATDVVGGFAAWRDAGLAVVRPTATPA